MFIMWFSGLRGGVAFALASVSYAANDFPTTCGGLTPEQRLGSKFCGSGMTDSLAVLQTTLVIAAFTIFVFGGAITDVALKLGVLADAKWNAQLAAKERKAELTEESSVRRMHQSMLLPCLTYETHDSGLRQDAAMEGSVMGFARERVADLKSKFGDTKDLL